MHLRADALFISSVKIHTRNFIGGIKSVYTNGRMWRYTLDEASGQIAPTVLRHDIATVDRIGPMGGDSSDALIAGFEEWTSPSMLRCDRGGLCGGYIRIECRLLDHKRKPKNLSAGSLSVPSTAS